MLFAVELDGIIDHECDIILECPTHLVLVPLRLILHVFKRDWRLHDIAVVGGILSRRLVVEQERVRADHQFLGDLHENNVEALCAILLLTSPALVGWLRGVLKVVVAETVRLELRRR